MKRRELMVGGAAALSLGACTPSKFRRYNGPDVTGIVVNKGDRRMFLMHEERVLKKYKIWLGFAPEGHKQIEGDGRTPEGLYTINRRNPNSRFHLSIGVSYPNEADIAAAKAMNAEPGGNIFIHGQKTPLAKNRGDWTWGCIAVSNKEMEQIYAMVKDGTPILIRP